MYEGLYDTEKGLSPSDATRIGLMTARLIETWYSWSHRRVERVSFCDEDALSRNVSIDFTIPAWFHELRGTPEQGAIRQLVPLGFLRKGSLVNFSLRNEKNHSLPLLNRPQNSQVAEALLFALAEDALTAGVPLDGPDTSSKIPSEIRCDIRDLVREQPAIAENTYRRLFHAHDQASEARQTLQSHNPFVVAADLFCRHFLALSMLDIARHERRIVHISYEEARSSPTTSQFRSISRQVRGHARVLTADVSALNEAASYHIEIEAPTGMMITARSSLYFDGLGKVIKAPLRRDIFKRAHFHFPDAAPRSFATVAVHLRPRTSSIIRAATLMGCLALAAVLVITFRFHHIEREDNAAAAALLLAAAGIIGVVVVRGGEDEMATTLLFPLRVLATVPVILAAFAAVVVVADPAIWLGSTLLGCTSALSFISTTLLLWNWRKIRRVARK